MTRVSQKRNRTIRAVNDNQTIDFATAAETAKHFGLKTGTIQRYAASGRHTLIKGIEWHFIWSSPDPKKTKVLAPTDYSWQSCVTAGYPEYECLADLRIRRVGAKYLVTHLDSLGDYIYVLLRNGTNRKTLRLHIVICASFNGPAPSTKHQVDHLNENKRDNHISNLEWTDKNVERAIGRPCERLLSNGSWQRFTSITAAGKETGINSNYIGDVMRKRRQRAGGFVWRLSQE